VLSEVRLDAPLNTGMEGRIYPPGAVVPLEQLGERPVVLECVGPENPMPRRRTAITWILWAWRDGEWRELARTAAMGAEWAEVLRRPAFRALHPDPGLVDVIRYSREAAEKIMETIDERMNPEPARVKGSILATIYDRIAGRIAALPDLF
jgi:hypothetical protein